ncbi:MAG: hypothetical protein UU98_C0007G0005 [Parcubacteria group bacterium GW2011_GWD2_42_14]|nr:MAG: hypothetical protein UU98_C0007G0005 [Parcubacteria group bacterium GW2011_GWD2_42_14]
MLRNLAKTIAVVVGSTLLATLAVNAFDFRDQYHTLLGGLLFSTRPFQGSCPDNMVYISKTLNPFCIDVYEVSAHEACFYQDPKNIDESMFNLSNTTCIPVARKERIPWRHVTRELAERACAQAGKRLPTPNEWFVAAFGTPDEASGWNEEDCNVAHNRAEGVSETGSGTRCISSAGAYDMIGNVWEWVEGTVALGMYQNSILPESGFVWHIRLGQKKVQIILMIDFGQTQTLRRELCVEAISITMMMQGYMLPMRQVPKPLMVMHWDSDVLCQLRANK